MKKIFCIISILLISVTLFGCKGQNNGEEKVSPNKNESGNNENIENNKTEDLVIEDYFPINENVRYVYEGNGNEYASYNVYIDYTSENKIQLRIDNGGTVRSEVIEVKDGKVKRILSKPETYYRENFLKKTGEEEVLLMEPLKNGTSWTLKDSSLRKITNTSADITTPLGSYKAIEVVTESKDGKTSDYYVKNIGLVKSVFIFGDNEVTSSLSNIEENASLVQNVSFFYPNINDDKTYYENKEVTFKTNDITKKVLFDAYKDTMRSKANKEFSNNVNINSLYLNQDGMVYVDLNEVFMKEMNAGALYESMILQSIANTFGKYYNSEKVILTIDNKLYESGHILMNKGEYLKVNYDNAIEVK